MQAKKSPQFILWMAALVIALLAGFFTAYKVFTEGQVLYGATDTHVWTLPLAAYTFFSLVSAGLALVASGIMVFGFDQYKPLVKRTVFLAIVSILAAFACMLLELGSPGNAVNFVTSPNPQSSLWWLSVLYTLHIVILVVTLWQLLAGKSGKVLGYVMFLLALVASSALGSTFGLVEARPVYFGEFLPIYFILRALLSGLAVILLIGLALAYFTKSEKDSSLFDELAKPFSAVVGIALIFFIWRSIVGSYAYSPEYNAFKHAMGTWPYQFELWLGLVVPLGLMIIPQFRKTVWAKVTAAALALVGVFAGSVQLLESGLSIPATGRAAVDFPVLEAAHYPVWEWLVVVFGLAVLLFLFTLGEQFLKLESAD